MQKFLVIQTAFIGDVVLATALLEKLHACFPEARIDLLVRKGNEALLNGHPWLHTVHVWDKKQHKLKNLYKLIRRIRKEQYETLINVQRFAATGILTVLSGAKETIGFDKNPLSRLFSKRIPHVIGGLHEVDRNQALISAFTDGRSARPRLYPTKTDEEKAAAYKDRPYITISPASVWFTKQYPAERWSDLIGELPGGYAVYLLGGRDDAELCGSLAAAWANGDRTGNKANVVSLAGKMSFLESAALQRDAVMNYVNDSAPLHFASAVNAPVTAVYCSTIPAFGFGPLSDNSHIVEIEEPLSCRPCGLHGYKACPLGHFNCAYKIQSRQLLQTLKEA